MDYTVHGVLQVRIPEWVAVPFSRGILPTQGSNPGLLHCRQIPYQLIHQGSSRVLEWVADLSLLQGIFPTQESNWGLLHCRQILYQLSYQEAHTVRALIIYLCDSKHNMYAHCFLYLKCYYLLVCLTNS